MTRKLSQFSGDYAVIGCSASHPNCEQKYHNDTNAYYSIDMDETNNPDFVFDITSNLPPEFNNRFQITFLENIDWGAYNMPPADYPESFRKRQGDKGNKGFLNIWNMTRDDGFIFIKGCPRLKEFRTSLCGLKYIETTDDNYPGTMECVIIPKNQLLTIEEFNQQIHENNELYSLINKMNTRNYVAEPFIYHETDYSSYGYARFNDKEKPDESIVEIIESRKMIPEIKAFYDCLEKLEQFSKTHSKTAILAGCDALSCPPAINKYKVFSEELKLSADHFFKNDLTLIQRDISVFRVKFSALINHHKQELSSFSGKTEESSWYKTAIAFLGFKEPTINELIASIENNLVRLGTSEFNVAVDDDFDYEHEANEAYRVLSV